MARQLVAILAAVVAFSGVSAGPCKPASSLTLPSTILLETTTTATSHETTSSTITADVIETTGTTDAVDTTSCDGRVLYNPGFDDSISSWPWDLNSGVQVSSVKPRSPSYCLTLTSASPSTTFSQALPALGDYEYELVYYISMQNYAINGFDFLCYANAFVNGKKMRDNGKFDGLGPFTYQRVSEIFTPQNFDDTGELRLEIQCEGEFRYAEMAVDDVSLTRRCGA
ncbi:hypothetical protein LZL87_012880 [Fusarium oxysporum]|nr:hypothetical protein LZL87_012880 [Fusarium oxysporum]